VDASLIEADAAKESVIAALKEAYRATESKLEETERREKRVSPFFLHF
jgi:hypothetical protein